jgi:hypothetical protein
VGCGCGCGAASRRRLRGATRSRYHAIGSSTVATAVSVADQFNVSQYIPPAVQDDVATGAAYYQTFSQATDALAGTRIVNGTVQISDSAQKALFGTFSAGISAVAPPLGAALALIWALGPHAGAGPGVCVSPPAGPALAQLKAWPHFVPWAGAYGPYSPGSFEAFAAPVLAYNWLLQQNCFAGIALPADALLAKLVTAWDATHAGAPRTLCRRFDHVTSFGSNPNDDPISDALYWSIVNDARYGGNPPDQATRCVAVNTGPQVVRVKALALHHLGPATSARAPASASSSASIAAGAAVVGLGAAGVFYASRAGLLPRWARRFF